MGSQRIFEEIRFTSKSKHRFLFFFTPKSDSACHLSHDTFSIPFVQHIVLFSVWKLVIMVIIASDQQVFPTPWWQGKCPDAPACACSEGWRWGWWWGWWWRHALSCYSVARWHVDKQCMLGAGGFAGNSSTARSSVEEIFNETSTLHCFSLCLFCRPLSVWACWAWRWTLQRIR